MKTFEHVLRFVVETPWAILPSKLAEIQAIIRDHLSGDREVIARRLDRFRAEQDASPSAASGTRTRDRVSVGSIGILPIWGTMIRHGDLFTEMSGGVDMARAAKRIEELASDPQIKGILLDIDSPGGSVDGTMELGDAIAKAAEAKPVFANANGLAASAAYWVGSQATEFSASPSSLVGSIGVLSVHEDFSKYLEDQGVKMSIIRAGRYKAEANPFEPLDDEARTERQRIVDAYHKQFIAAVAKGRSTSQANVRENFGQGRVVMAGEAKSRGMVDRIETINETMGRLMRRADRANGRSARAQMATVRDFEAFLREAGDFSRKEAKMVASGGWKAALDGAAAETGEAPLRDGGGEAAEGAQETDPVLQAAIQRFLETVNKSNPKGGSDA